MRCVLLHALERTPANAWNCLSIYCQSPFRQEGHIQWAHACIMCTHGIHYTSDILIARTHNRPKPRL